MVSAVAMPVRGGFHDGASAASVAEFERAGFVVLDDWLPGDLLASLRSEFMSALEAKVARFNLPRASELDPRIWQNDQVSSQFDPMGANHDLNRWNMHLPSRLPFLDPRLIANPRVMEVVDEILGDDCVLNVIASDTPFPGSGYQSVHQDGADVSIYVNVPLVDVDEDKGPIEVWPRTHRPNPEHPGVPFQRTPHWIPPEQIEVYRETLPSRRLLLRQGSVLIRDMRMLHRGTPNRSAEPRPMLSLLYRVCPRQVPYRVVVDATAKVGEYLRERAIRGTFNSPLLKRRNDLGWAVELFAGSDRDCRRRIPRDVWAGLPVRARRLLRYASVEGGIDEPPRRSLAASMRLISAAKSIMGDAWRPWDPGPPRVQSAASSPFR